MSKAVKLISKVAAMTTAYIKNEQVLVIVD